MLALRSFARSTLGELKDALIDGDEQDEEEEQEQSADLGELVTSGPAPPQPELHAALPPPPPEPWGETGALRMEPLAPGVSDRPVAAEELRLPSVPASTLHAPGVRDAVTAAPAALGVATRDMASGPAPSAHGGPGEPLPASAGRPVEVTAARAGDLVPGATTAAEGPSAAQPTEGALTAALQGEVAQPLAQLVSDASEARRRFAALLAVPCLIEVLQDSGAIGVDRAAWASAGSPSVPKIAAQCAEALRTLTPRLLGADKSSDKQYLLESFNERYDSLLAQYEVMQQRCRQMVEQEESNQQLAQQNQAWQSAHRTATARIEDLSLENADLKERLREFESRPSEAQLLQRLAQREAEVRAANEALQRLQEVLEESSGRMDARCRELEQELQASRLAAAELAATREAGLAGVREAHEAAAAAAARESALLQRCSHAEREAQESNQALEALLQEKERHMEEREHHVDSRLVTSMLALYLDHLASGQRTLADQVLNQTLQVLGGLPAVADRQRLRSVTEAEEKLAEEPLGDAFLDFLTRETSSADAAAAEGRPPRAVAAAGGS